MPSLFLILCWLVCFCRRAQSLLLNDNLIMAIPVAVGMLTNLDELRIDGNDLKVCERLENL